MGIVIDAASAKAMFEACEKRTEILNFRIPRAYKYAISKGMYEKHLKNMSQVVELCCKEEYNLNQIIDRFTKEDWRAILSGESEFKPKEEQKCSETKEARRKNA